MDYRSLITEPMRNLRALFVQEGRDIRIVGGAVRDLLLDIKPKDIDFCTDATPQEQIAIYQKHNVSYYETGLAHGTLTVVLEDRGVYEITSLRVETDHDGRHAKVTYTDDWLADLGRRDLTVNAMALSFDGDLMDPFGGARDLDSCNVRFVGDPDSRMKEDYLRILRWLRFHGRLAEGIPLDPATVEAAIRNAPGLKNISRERVWMEMSKIISGPGGANLIDSIYDLEIAGPIGLPMGNVARLSKLHTHTRNPIALMVGLLEYPSEVHKIAKDWRWSAEERDMGMYLASDTEGVGDETTPREYGSCEYEFVIQKKPREWVVQLAWLRGDAYSAGRLSHLIVPPFPVDGMDLQLAGLKPGPAIGKALRLLKSYWMHAGYKFDKNTLMMIFERDIKDKDA